MTQQPHVVYQPVQQSNGLGTAGFILSLVGLVTGGILSPIGLIISLIALGKHPKGLAIAGVIIGLIGSCGIIATVMFAGAAILAALGIGIAAAVAQGDQWALVSDMSTITVAHRGVPRQERRPARGSRRSRPPPVDPDRPVGQPVRVSLHRGRRRDRVRPRQRR